MDKFFANQKELNDLSWLRQAGFEATCLHLHLNRALIAGVK